ncbi:MAG: DUF2480 family protein [Flavobacterium sp.]|nr:DUF2480 family protein [Candidatus Neoflavobacterium equi]
MEEIVNKVANSALKVFDLEDYFPKQPIKTLDISHWLLEGIVLREKEFRAALKDFDWTPYQGSLVAMYCSTDAILPAWAFMLVSSYLQPVALEVTQGNKETLLLNYYNKTIQALDFEMYRDQPVIVKGCSKQPIPEQVYVMATQKMMNYARSIMFGEACSAVPIFKRQKI